MYVKTEPNQARQRNETDRRNRRPYSVTDRLQTAGDKHATAVRDAEERFLSYGWWWPNHFCGTRDNYIITSGMFCYEETRWLFEFIDSMAQAGVQPQDRDWGHWLNETQRYAGETSVDIEVRRIICLERLEFDAGYHASRLWWLSGQRYLAGRMMRDAERLLAGI